MSFRRVRQLLAHGARLFFMLMLVVLPVPVVTLFMTLLERRRRAVPMLVDRTRGSGSERSSATLKLYAAHPAARRPTHD